MTSSVIYLGKLRTKSEHLNSGSSYFTDAPVDNNGKGEAFSPTDTVATGLASCMLTVMGIKAENIGVNMENTKAEVTKTMASDPRRISKVKVAIHFPETYDGKTRKVLERIARTCPVAQSLHPNIEQLIEFHYPNE